MLSGDVVKMTNKSSLIDLSILLLSTIILAFCSPFFKCVVIMVYIAYIYYYKKDILVYINYFFKVIFILVPIILIMFLIRLKLITIISQVVSLAFFITSLYLFCKEYNSMEIYFAITCILSPLDYVGLSSNKIGWFVTRKLRNAKIYIETFKKNVKDNIGSFNNFENTSIYDRINNSRQKVRSINKLANLKINQLDQMMYLRLFDINYYRTNYFVQNVKLGDFIFMIILFIVLISEVII